MNKQERADFFNQSLDRAGVPNWGRNAELVKRIKCSPATAQGWCRGSLPKDPQTLVSVCDAYNIDLYAWVDGRGRGSTSLNTDKLISAIEQAKKLFDAMGLDLGVKQYAKVISYLYSLNGDGDVVEAITNLINE